MNASYKSRGRCQEKSNNIIRLIINNANHYVDKIQLEI